MKTIVKVADLVTADEHIILQGCNAQGVMGSGVAKAFKTKWHGNYLRYRSEYDANGLPMGSIVWYDTGEQIIGNAITQEFYGRDNKKYVSYDAVDDAMKIVYRYAMERGVDAVAMPAIGAGLGGGEWSIIKAIIETQLKTVTPVLYVLENEVDKFT